MIETADDTLILSAPELDPAARLVLSFSGHDHSDASPAASRLPLQRVDDHADHVPSVWLAAGGVMIPRPATHQLRLIVGPADGATDWPQAWALTLGIDGVDLLTGRPWSPHLHPQLSAPVPRRRPYGAPAAGSGPPQRIAPPSVIGIPRGARIVPNYVRLSRGRTLDLPTPAETLHLTACPATTEVPATRGGRVVHERGPQTMPAPRPLTLPWALDHACSCLVRLVPPELWASITGARKVRHRDRLPVRELPPDTGSQRRDVVPVQVDRIVVRRPR